MINSLIFVFDIDMLLDEMEITIDTNDFEVIESKLNSVNNEILEIVLV